MLLQPDGAFALSSGLTFEQNSRSSKTGKRSERSEVRDSGERSDEVRDDGDNEKVESTRQFIPSYGENENAISRVASLTVNYTDISLRLLVCFLFFY
jgi:hypothetical protein